MSLAQQHEADLLRHQVANLKASADIQIDAANAERARALGRAAIAEANFRRLICFAALGWILFSVLAVAILAHPSAYHSSSTGAAISTTAAPAFSSEVTK